MAQRYPIDGKLATCKNCGDYRVFWVRSNYGKFYLVNVNPDNTFAKNDFHTATCGVTLNQLPPVAATSEVNSATVDMLNQMYSKPAVWPGTPLSNPQTIGRMTGNGQSVQNLPREMKQAKTTTYTEYVASTLDPNRQQTTKPMAVWYCVTIGCRYGVSPGQTTPNAVLPMGKTHKCQSCDRPLKFLSVVK